MPPQIEEWLGKSGTPEDLYELLGHQLLHPDCRVLQQAIREANGYLKQHQDLADAARHRRTRELQMMLGQAEQTFGDEARKQAYDNLLISRLGQLYAAGTGESPGTWQEQNIRRWLQVRRVNPDQIGRVTREILRQAREEVAGEESAATRPADGGTFRERAFQAAPRHRERPGGRPVTGPDTSRRSQRDRAPGRTGQPGGGKTTGESKAEAASSSNTSGAAGNRAGPAASPESPGQGRRLRPVTSAPVPAGLSPLPARPRSGSASSAVGGGDGGLLWIVASAVVTALVLGLIMLVFVVPYIRPSRGVASNPTSVNRQSAAENVPGRNDAGAAASATPETANAGTDRAADESGTDDASAARPPVAPGPTSGPSGAAEGSSSSSAGTAEAGSAPAEGGAAEGGAAEPSAPSGNSPADAPADSTSAGAEIAAARLTLNHGSSVYGLTWDRDGQRFALHGDGARLTVWNVNGEMVKGWDAHAAGIAAVAWSPEGKLIATAGSDGRLSVWSTADWSEQMTWSTPAVTSLVWLRDGKRLAAGGSDGAVRIWDAETGAENAVLDVCKPAGAVRCLAASRLSDTLYAGHVDGTVAKWTVNRLKPTLARLLMPVEGAIFKQLIEDRSRVHGAILNSVATPYLGEDCFDLDVAADDLSLAVCGGPDVEVWAMASPREGVYDGVNVRTYYFPWNADPAHGYRAVHWNPRGGFVAAGSAQGDVSIWSFNESLCRVRLEATLDAPISVLRWNSAGTRLAVGTDGGKVTVLRFEEDGLGFAPAPTWTVEALEKSSELVADEDWTALGRVVRKLETYSLGRANDLTLEKLRSHLKTYARTELNELRGATLDTKDDVLNHFLSLQDLVDLLPRDPRREDVRGDAEKMLEDVAKEGGARPARSGTRR